MVRQALQGTVGVLIAALVVRTWYALGIVMPIEVTAASMAPTLLGPHRQAVCPACRAVVAIGEQYAPFGGTLCCPDCARRLELSSAARRRGDSMWIDRLSLSLRSPRRWEAVVFRCPEDAKAYCVKRVVGLPGEQIAIREGDVYVNGRLAQKRLEAQRRMRILVHRERESRRRWEPARAASPWHWSDRRWQCDASNHAAELVYRGEPVADSYAYNADGARGRYLVRDLQLSVLVASEGEGILRLRLVPQGQVTELRIQPASGQICLEQNGTVCAEKSLAAAPHGTLHVEFSLFDGRALVAVDGQRSLACRLPGGELVRRSERAAPAAVSAENLQVRLSQLCLWRDVHYTAPTGRDRWQLGPQEYFVLGDNSPVSVDSRRWRHGPGLSAKLLVGRPLRFWP